MWLMPWNIANRAHVPIVELKNIGQTCNGEWWFRQPPKWRFLSDFAKTLRKIQRLFREPMKVARRKERRCCWLRLHSNCANKPTTSPNGGICLVAPHRYAMRLSKSGVCFGNIIWMSFDLLKCGCFHSSIYGVEYKICVGCALSFI